MNYFKMLGIHRIIITKAVQVSSLVNFLSTVMMRGVRLLLSDDRWSHPASSSSLRVPKLHNRFTNRRYLDKLTTYWESNVVRDVFTVLE